jgi:hypothetical protein
MEVDMKPIDTLSNHLVKFRARFLSKRQVAEPVQLPLWDSFTETWTEEERIAFVDRWTTWVNHPDNPDRHYYPSSVFDADQKAWDRDWADYADVPQDRIESGKKVLLAYPTQRKLTIELIAKNMREEHAGRFSLLIRQRITEFNENDAYILDIIDEGFIVNEVPWAVLRYAYDGRTIARAHYLELKQAVHEANISTTEETLALIRELLDAYRARKRAYLESPRDSVWEEDDRRVTQDRAVGQRYFEIVYPERMVRLSDGTLYADHGPLVSYTRKGPAD